MKTYINTIFCILLCIIVQSVTTTAHADFISEYHDNYYNSAYVIDDMAYRLDFKTSTAVVEYFYKHEYVHDYFFDDGYTKEKLSTSITYDYNNEKKYIGDVVVPETVEYDGQKFQVVAVDPHAFDNCPEVTNVVIPESVFFDYGYWTGGRAIIDHETDELMWLGTDGNNYHNPFPWLLKQPAGTTIYVGDELAFACSRVLGDPSSTSPFVKEEFSIKEGTKKIRDRAMRKFRASHLKLPASMEVIGEEALAPSTFDSIDFGGTKIIGKKAFMGAQLKTLDLGRVEEIGDSAFFKAMLPSQLVISSEKGLEIHPYAFSLLNDGIWGSVQLKLGKNVKAGKYAFFKSLIDKLTFDNTAFLDDHAFSRNIFTSLSIPAGTTMGAAFTDCPYLSTVKIGNNVTINGNRMLGRCPKLETLTIGNNVTINGDEFCADYSYSDSCSLKNITFGENVTLNGKRYFYNNSKVNTLKLGKNMKLPGAPFAFYLLKTIEVPKDDECNATQDGVLYTKDFSELICLPNNAKGDEQRCVILNPALKRIRSNSIYRYRGNGTITNQYLYTPYTGVSIPAGVESIEPEAFSFSYLYVNHIYSHILDPTGVAVNNSFVSPYAGREGTLHVPRGSYLDYKNTEPWNRFFLNIVRDLDDDRVFAYDVNNDKIVNGSDVTALYNLLLSLEDGQYELGECPPEADIDGNGILNGADVTQLYNILLNR